MSHWVTKLIIFIKIIMFFYVNLSKFRFSLIKLIMSLKTQLDQFLSNQILKDKIKIIIIIFKM